MCIAVKNKRENKFLFIFVYNSKKKGKDYFLKNKKNIILLS